MKVKQFAIAKSSNGTIGLITSQSMVEHTYPEGATVQVWSGIILKDNTFKARNSEETIQAKRGGLWTSSNPEVIGEATPELILEGALIPTPDKLPL
jgi:hypothetical protein